MDGDGGRGRGGAGAGPGAAGPRDRPYNAAVGAAADASLAPGAAPDPDGVRRVLLEALGGRTAAAIGAPEDPVVTDAPADGRRTPRRGC